MPSWVITCFANKKRATDRLADNVSLSSDYIDNDNLGGIELAVNPLHSNVKGQEELAQLKEQEKRQEDAQKLLMERLKTAKKNNTSADHGNFGKRRGKKKKNITKKGFAQEILKSGQSFDGDEVSFSTNPLHK